MKQKIEQLVSQAIRKIAPGIADEIDFSVSVSPNPELGDYSTNAALILAKKLGRSPQDVASELAAELHEPQLLREVLAVGGFVNFFVSQGSLLENLNQVLSQGELYGSSQIGQGQKVLVEYFQPNMAKPLHLGHLRTAVIGDSVFRILKFSGFNVESDTHLGDWGTQFGLLILAYKKYGEQQMVEKDPILELNKLYVKINAEVELDESVREQGKAEFVKLEQGDVENTGLWEKFRAWSWTEYDIVYKDLGVRKADHDWPESFFQDKMPEVLDMLRGKGLLIESQGAQIVDLENEGLGVAVIVKSDGGTTYLLRDLATYIFRKAQGFAKQIYVVDVRQSQTLAQTFKILELLGVITTKDEVFHLSYGFLTLPDGAMSTRKGNVVGLVDVVRKAQELALEIIEKKNPNLEKKSEVAAQVAVAAIKYFDLSRNPKGDIVFTWDKALSFEGNTGPYMQYAFARIQSILRKSEVTLGKLEGFVAPETADQAGLNLQALNLKDQERVVLRKLLYFPEVVKQSAVSLMPNHICNYIFELAQDFNSFYEACPVLKEDQEDVRNFRLVLCTGTAQVIKNSLGLLGVQAPEEM